MEGSRGYGKYLHSLASSGNIMCARRGARQKAGTRHDTTTLSSNGAPATAGRNPKKSKRGYPGALIPPRCHVVPVPSPPAQSVVVARGGVGMGERGRYLGLGREKRGRRGFESRWGVLVVGWFVWGFSLSRSTTVVLRGCGGGRPFNVTFASLFTVEGG